MLEPYEQKLNLSDSFSETPQYQFLSKSIMYIQLI
jgi:hypothetical protein